MAFEAPDTVDIKAPNTIAIKAYSRTPFAIEALKTICHLRWGGAQNQGVYGDLPWYWP